MAHGPDIAPETPGSKRTDYSQVVLARRLQHALTGLNSGLPAEALDDARRRLTQSEGSTLKARNRFFHKKLVNGVEVEYWEPGGRVRGHEVRVIDFESTAVHDTNERIT